MFSFCFIRNDLNELACFSNVYPNDVTEVALNFSEKKVDDSAVNKCLNLVE